MVVSREYEASVAPSTMVPSVAPLGTRYHWMAAAGRPEATTVKVAISPSVTDTEEGWDAMTGGFVAASSP